MSDQQIGLSKAEAQYRATVARALDAARARAPEALDCDAATARFIVFSDLHKGARNGADDFLRCERAYNAALAWYFRRGYTLVELGDVEELWEERPGPVLRNYRHTLRLTAEFHAAGRYQRVYGNHDDLWSFQGKTRRLLGPIFSPSLAVRESALLNVRSGDTHLGFIFMLHGHQGTGASDQWSWLSRIAVRLVWRNLQRIFKVSLNTPADSWELRERHNLALHDWAARQHALVLIAGHTHRPVFTGRTLAQKLAADLAQAEADNRRERAAQIAANLEWARAQDGSPTGAEGAVVVKPECYFNTGCCAYSDGDVTGLEITDGKLVLVRWPNDSQEALPKYLTEPVALEALFPAPVADPAIHQPA